MPRSEDQLIDTATQRYINQLKTMSQIPAAPDIVSALLDETWMEIDGWNAARMKGQKKIPQPTALSVYQVANLILALEPVKRISLNSLSANPDLDIIGVYQTTGQNKGLYDTSRSALNELARKYNTNLKIRDINEVVAIITDKLPRTLRNNNKNLIAVNNGIFDYDTKTLMPFSPDYVFLTKSAVNYVPNPVNPVIHNPDDGTDWDVVSWMESLSDDPEIVLLLWQIIGATIRPNVSWNKSAWLYSTTGNNGKGTLCEFIRAIVGENACASIPLANFGKEFDLEQLISASAIVVDENDVGGFIDRSANIKAVITGDTILINRKYKTPIPFRFKGFMVQCLNEMPRIRDKSESNYRRMLFIPMNKCFTGVERKYIKSDYLHRKDVLEYALWYVLAGMDDYTKLSEPESCKLVLDEYRSYNDPVREFCDEILPQCQWDLLPFTFLYDLFTVWSRRNSPSGKQVGRNTFIQGLLAILSSYPDWVCQGIQKAIRPGHRMDTPEPLVLEYDLTAWQNPLSSSKNPKNKCIPVLKPYYRGLIRVGGPQQQATKNDTDDTNIGSDADTTTDI